MVSFRERIAAVIKRAQAVDLVVPNRKVREFLVSDLDAVVSGQLDTAARDAVWEEAAVMILTALPVDSPALLSFISSNVPKAGSEEDYPEDPHLYAVQRAADAGNWIRSLPRGQHRAYAVSLARDAGVVFECAQECRSEQLGIEP